MVAVKTLLRMIVTLIFVISAPASLAATAMPTAHAKPPAHGEMLTDCHETAQKSVKSGKSQKTDPAETCCDKACACALNHCQTPATTAPQNDTAPEPSATTRYDVFSKRLLSALREQVKPPPKS